MYEEDKDRNWNREPEEERPKKGGILKKAAWITAGADGANAVTSAEQYLSDLKRG